MRWSVDGEGFSRTRILDGVDRLVEPIQYRHIGIDGGVHDLVKELVRTGTLGHGVKLVQVCPKTRADTFLNRDQVITTEEYVEIRNLQLARTVDVYRLQDDEDVVCAFFNFGSLVPMAAVFNMERVQVKLFR